MSATKLELGELIEKLKCEKLFITNERRELETLNKNVHNLCRNLVQQSWMTGQKRLALEHLGYSNLESPFSIEINFKHDENNIGSVTEATSQFGNAQFDPVDAQKKVSPRYYQSYLDLFILLRSQPNLVSLLITTYEKERQFLMPWIADAGTAPSGVSASQVLQAIVNVYGGIGGPLPGDGMLHLKLLSALAGTQILGSENPRRVLRQGSSAFSTLYRLISDTIPKARLFLIGSLHHPVSHLLASPELLSLGTLVTPSTPLSIEASFATGSSSTVQPVNKDIALLDRTEKMAKLTQLFLQSILDNFHSFPTGLAWLIKSIQRQLEPVLPVKEIKLICTDLIWALFICPAVTNPEPFGVTDTPIGSQERHVLSQVATILQSLAYLPYEPTPANVAEYIYYFDTTLCSSILDRILEIENPAIESSDFSSLFRQAIFIPESQLAPLFSWLKETLVLLERNGKLTEIEEWPVLVKLSATLSESLPSIPRSPSPSVKGSSSPIISPSHRPTNFGSMGVRNSSLLSRKESPRNVELPTIAPASTVVLAFPVSTEEWEWVGMLPEREVWKLEKGVSGESSSNDREEDSICDEVDGGETDEKRTRFSVSQDECSFAGMSDVLEAASASGGASTRSVSSSMDEEVELEDANDNLSDMITSANVSGRGSPNVSGRNTPLSQVGEANLAPPAEDRARIRVADNEIVDGQLNEQMEEGNPQRQDVNPPNLNNLNLNGEAEGNPRARIGGRNIIENISAAVGKQARSEIDDKFCKFEIKRLIGEGDETISLVSDTWSTDVLASDSEFGGSERRQLLLPLPSEVGERERSSSSRPSIDAASAYGGGETMSEAWSTDVAASDIERLTDFDPEEAEAVLVTCDDTPRSSVSGSLANPNNENSNSGFPPQPIDMLLFDDLNDINMRSEVVSRDDASMIQPNAPPDSTTNGGGNLIGMEVDDSLRASSSSLNSTLANLPVGSSSNSVLMVPSGSGTGKSISFDKTADRVGDDGESSGNGGGSGGRTRKFFRNFKLFRGRGSTSFAGNGGSTGRKPGSSSDGTNSRFDWARGGNQIENPSFPVPKLMKKSVSEDLPSSIPVPGPSSFLGLNESSDDILAKYRRKPSITDSVDDSSVTAGRNMVSGGNDMKPIIVPPGDSGTTGSVHRKESLKVSRAELAAEARKKLRLVLGNCDLSHLHEDSRGASLDSTLVHILRKEVADAISRGDHVTAAQIGEAIRTIQLLGIEGCKRVIRQLRDDYKRRNDYVSYLHQAKQELLCTQNFLEKNIAWTKHEGEIYTSYAVNEWLRLRLEESEEDSKIAQWVLSFRAKTTVDEKLDVLEEFCSKELNTLTNHCSYLTESQKGAIRKALETQLVTRVYPYALYPNGEVDIHRDKVLHDHIEKLSAVVTPSHKDLRIPRSHLGECPWAPAQREFRLLSAYKSANEKLRCVLRASTLILNLLASSAEKTMAADDFVPVLVYVLIKANPPALLSTIQYVTSFEGAQMNGEESYWWTQFCSAVEFIKTMDYND